MSTKRAYKLQEFVAHASTVNCLKIGRKSSRVLVTGGEDHKVNLWAIGKPNAILSLSGHTSGIDSVSFDSSEVLVAAGAASGTIKLWDLEEAKIVRTLTGHRSNCASVDFHPFGEFFASGSLDTNLKIWDIRKKGCIHTYKGHTRGVNAIRFTPDGRWVVSGGEDNSVKLWDLTAGKLLHDFKCHEGQIQCIDFHPHEFLLATGSADRTVKFWDLETFELIGSAGPETTGVRSITFSPDGRTLLCGLHESLKVFSWEPIRCHDMVDIGWSRLSDLNVHEGKLLGCSYNQSCVGVWVVDISRIEPYAPNDKNRLNGHSETKSSSGNISVVSENTAKARLSVSQNTDPLQKETKSLGRLSVSEDSDPVKEGKHLASTGSAPSTPQRISLNSSSKTVSGSLANVPNTITQKRSSLKSHSTSNIPNINKSDIIPVIVPRSSGRSEPVAEPRKEVGISGRMMQFSLQSKAADLHNLSNRDEVDKLHIAPLSESAASTGGQLSTVADKKTFPPAVSLTQDETRGQKGNRDFVSVEGQKGGRIRSLVNWEKRDRSLNCEAPTSGISHARSSSVHLPAFNGRGHSTLTEKATVSASDEDAIADLMEQHDQFLSLMQARSTKLQAVFRYWERSDVKGVIGAMEKMDDHAVIADVVSIIMEKIDIVTLDICTSLLPLLSGLLQSELDRHLGISLEMLLKLVRTFGSVIYSTISATASVGVDIEAEQRLERCNLCFIELEKVKRILPSLTRRGGSIAKSAQELNLTLQDVS
ncbi:katanin p80 WD40 repeat-containing subunit B1 homolog KTN80.3-like isoform X2 [Prosopis cineraria]|uniref:katanin p80 WD40 repeat-containing subunit B1 homolog KTN80.3-like isoform X2 n=1 Tax=Prosopis cineraria TaxID=364024 RepID=UPI00240FB7EB|nr:katanin p80 WD40 repeat-containing subunit B1 homolog KTN80.3-like isoform X2 [Prosopis cineraria]